ncbi:MULTISPECIES: hypothetical protein [Streptacidiphilus]|uniref:Uncharacterized protein n=2 Tax=Streptacidiphilus TaxID=228398 RepID=A0ABV6UPQ8_9ACTN|nr:hypothetical protein [Streptacidiphilus jeojiense]
MVQLSKASLIGILMDNGEEDAAVRLAVSDLPEVLDIDGHARQLEAAGLAREDLDALLPATAHGPFAALRAASPDASARKSAAEMEQTVSQRWADLVSQWIHPSPVEPDSPGSSAWPSRSPKSTSN